MNIYTIVALVCLWFCAGCSPAQSVATSTSEAGPLGLTTPAEAQGSDVNSVPDQLAPEITGQLSLPQALDLSLTHNPGLKALSWDAHVAQANSLQAQLLPNPELEAEMEGIGGSGPRSDFGGAETTVTVSQPIQRGGKREARIQVASYEKQLTGWDWEQACLELKAQTTIAFAEVALAQEREALARGQVALSEDLLDTVRKRVQAGKDSPVEQSKAQISLSTSQMELAQSQQTLAGARIRLAVLWGGKPSFSRVTDLGDRIVMPPEQDGLVTSIESHPYVARWADEIAKAEAEKALARSEAVSDITLLAGLKRYEEDHDNAAVIGLSIPLPLFNRNQGARQQATFRLAQARQRQTQAVLQISAALSESHSALGTAYGRIMGLKDQILPAAETAFQGTLTGYKQGKFGYLSVLDAQRTLFELRKQHIEGRLAYHKARAELERLVGHPLEPVAAEK